MVTKCLLFDPLWVGIDDGNRFLVCVNCNFWHECLANKSSLASMTLEQRVFYIASVNMQKHLELVKSKTSNLYEK